MEDVTNNQEEADTLLMHCLYNARINESSALVHAKDTDVFGLLTAHRHRIKCKSLVLNRLLCILMLSIPFLDWKPQSAC